VQLQRWLGISCGLRLPVAYEIEISKYRRAIQFFHYIPAGAMNEFG
jgi:hypothetical protein